MNKFLSSYRYWIIFILVAGLASFVLVKEIQRLYDVSVIDLNTSDAAAGTTLSLSPSAVNLKANTNVPVDINLNTGGVNIDGVDVFYLRFNASLLQVVDSDAVTTGVQIAPGTLFPITLANTVDNVNGTISFTQAAAGGSFFNGSGKLATVTFRGISNSTTTANFDFTLGSTTDTNVSGTGVDQLAQVSGTTFTIDVSAPIVSLTAPASGSTLSGTTTVSATATDNVGVVGVKFSFDGTQIGVEDTTSPYSVSWNTTIVANGTHTLTADARDAVGNITPSTSILVSVSNDTTPPTVSLTAPTNNSSVTGNVTLSATAIDNFGVAGVQFKVDGVNVGAEDTASPYSVIWNSAGAANGSHTITAVARDTSSLTTTSSLVTVTATNALLKTTTVNLSFEGRASKIGTGKLQILDSSRVFMKEYNFTTNAAGQASVTIDLLPQTMYLRVNVVGYLTRLLGPMDYNVLAALQTFPLMLAGDLTNDNIVNSIDFSYMNARWFSTDPTADINQDGLVNTVDFSWMNKNWFVLGE